MLNETRNEEIIALCQALVQRQSYSGQEADVANYIQQFARTKLFDEVEVDVLGNVLLTINGKEAGPTILLDGHIDTVPVHQEDWTVNPYGGERTDSKIFGRGTSDMKGAVSGMILAANYLAEDTGKNFRGKIVVSCSVHEECFEGVATRTISAAKNPDYVVIGEATDLQLNHGQRGRAEIVVTTVGKPAHSSNPDKGINAVYQMTKLLDAIRMLPISTHEILGKGILELTDIQSAPYPGASVVPSQCRVTFDRRLLVGETKESVLAPIQEVITQLTEKDITFKASAMYSAGSELCYTGATIAAERFFPAWLFDAQADFVQVPLQALQKAGISAELSHYSFCTNGSHFAGEVEIPTIGFGPSLESLAHVDDEYIEIDQLTKATHGYYAIIQALQTLTVGTRKGSEQYV